jgi:hypothetical protein
LELAANEPSALLQAVDQTMAGEPLDARGEQAAQASGWRPAR